ncbi:hypothetical protein [Streptomyces fractus]|uniref:recombination directionality factor n=1 Tax=Streptomyces fractus TaxID=641806 RepID=UPI003CFB0E25
MTTEHRVVRDGITELCGGRPQETATEHGPYEVMLGRSELDVVATRRDVVANRFVLAGDPGTAHVCDGQRLLEPAGLAGAPCGCPTVMAERKAAARLGRGPSPRSRLTFRLREAPELGRLSFDSGGWSFSEQLSLVAQELGRLSGSALLKLSLDISRMTTRTGDVVAYTRPAVVTVGPCSTRRVLGLAA